jgi:hypothetical protein
MVKHMKGQTAYYAIAIIAVLAVAFAATGGWQQMGLIDTGCRIMKPVWGFYKCEVASVPVDYVTENVYVNALSTEYRRYDCNNLDIARNAIQVGGQYRSCAISVTNPAGGGNWDYMICMHECTPYMKAGPNYGGTTETVGLDFGEYIKIRYNGPLFGSLTYPTVGQYKQKQLVYHDWYGYESETQGIGCDIRAVLPYTEWLKLPKDSLLSLNIDQRQNFVVGWIDLPVVGNFYTHPLHGDVICTPNHVLYKVKPYTVANAAGEAGIYEDNAGNCYLIPETNPVESNVDCCPGEVIGGYTCNNANELVGVVEGECCRGGICTALYCPGGGSEFCDLSSHTVSKFECRESDGACVDTLNKYAECCPPDIGCGGNQFCDAETYTCKDKPIGLIPCPRECCTADTIDLTYYQEHLCAGGLECCPGGYCAESCDGIPEQDLTWLLIPVLAALLGIVGYYASGVPGAIILGILGGVIGYLVYWVSQLAWWAQILLALGLGGLGVLGIYLFAGTISAIIIAIVLAKVK